MTSHYLFEAESCNPACGWEKGQVEKNVQDARHRLWQSMPPFENLDALRKVKLAPGALLNGFGAVFDGSGQNTASFVRLQRWKDGVLSAA